MVSAYDLSIPGGVQAQVDGLAEALQRLGSTVTVLGPMGPGALQHERGYELVPIGRSFRVPVNGSRAPVAPGPITMARTIRVLRRLRPDVVHVHEPLVPGSSLAAVAAGPRPIVATFHRSGADALYRAEGAALRVLARRLGALVAVSEAARTTATEVLGSLAGPIELIPNGVDLQRYSGVVAAVPRPHGGGPDDPLRVLFVGRNEERKGLRVLLEAARHLRGQVSADRLPSWRLVVAGPGTEDLAHDTAGDDFVDWAGAVDDAEKAHLMTSADVYVAPSIRGESFGVILLEAMAAGTAVIASDLPGYRLAAGDAAHLVPAGDAEALAGALGRLIADPQARAALGRKSLERAREFSMDSIAGRYLELYDGLTGTRS